MRLFLAGAGSQRKELGRVIRDVLPRFGCTAYDWTADAGWDDPTQHDPIRAAEKDLRELRTADAVIWRLSQYRDSHGAPFEAGYAFAIGKPIVIWGLPVANHLIYGRLLDRFGTRRSNQLSVCIEMAKRLVKERNQAAVGDILAPTAGAQMLRSILSDFRQCLTKPELALIDTIIARHEQQHEASARAN